MCSKSIDRTWEGVCDLKELPKCSFVTCAKVSVSSSSSPEVFHPEFEDRVETLYTCNFDKKLNNVIELRFDTCPLKLKERNDVNATERHNAFEVLMQTGGVKEKL